jgi:uncharacterized protein with PIN domain
VVVQVDSLKYSSDVTRPERVEESEHGRNRKNVLASMRDFGRACKHNCKLTCKSCYLSYCVNRVLGGGRLVEAFNGEDGFALWPSWGRTCSGAEE